MPPLIVTAQRIDQTHASTLASAGQTDEASLASVAAEQKGAEQKSEQKSVKQKRVEEKRSGGASEDTAPDGVLVGGLVVNETFSVIGARFVQAFNDKWTEPEDARDIGYTITLGENPAPRRGAQVFVEVEGQMLFQGYLRPNRRQIHQAARQAVQRATLYVRKYYEPREVY